MLACRTGPFGRSLKAGAAMTLVSLVVVPRARWADAPSSFR